MTGISICVTAGFAQHTVADAARTFARAIIMAQTCTAPLAATAAGGGTYASGILAGASRGVPFSISLIVLYPPIRPRPNGIRQGSPRCRPSQRNSTLPGATDHSDSGNASGTYFRLLGKAMARTWGLALLGTRWSHACQMWIFDREKAFIDQQLGRLVERFPT